MSEAINGSIAHSEGSIPVDELLLVTNAGFTEQFMDGVRERNPKGGFVWRNPQTGARLPHPLDVSRRDPNAEGTILARLRVFCEDKPIPFVWTVDQREDRQFVCRIGVHQGDAEAELLGYADTPSFGFSVAIAMLQASGYDFHAARKELVEDAPRIQLDG